MAALHFEEDAPATTEPIAGSTGTALARLPASAAVATAAPQPDADGTRERTDREGLRDVAETDPAPEMREHRVTVRRGDTLLDILKRAGVVAQEAHAAVAGLRTVYNPRRLQPGQELELALDHDIQPGVARLASLTVAVDASSKLRLDRNGDGLFDPLRIERPSVVGRVHFEGRIASSLYQAARAAGLPRDALAQLIKVFSWDIDFQREVQPGDGFEAVIEQAKGPAGKRIGEASLLFAAVEVGGRRLTAYRFERADGSFDFFDERGRPLRKWLLRTPVDGARLSSNFGPRRHPILGYTRMHRGVDFAAPTGTPILAAGDGRVEFLGRNRGYGNYVRIQHNGEFSTAYAHLSRFAKGLEKGATVRQGTVIGYVGSTGMSTGPHLHYEILRGGRQIDPLSVKTLDQVRLAGAELRRFTKAIEAIDAERGTTDVAGIELEAARGHN